MCTSPYLGAISEPSCLIFLAPGLAQRHRPLHSKATFGHKNTDTDASLGRNADERIFSQSKQIAFTKPNNQPQLHSQTNLLDHPYDWYLVSFRIETQYSIGSKMGLAGGELSALMPAGLWHHILFNFPAGNVAETITIMNNKNTNTKTAKC